MNDPLVLEMFSSHVGDSFVMKSDTSTVTLELIEATELPAQKGAPRQDPFSLLFRAPKDSGLWQGMWRLEHDQLGPVELFLVPVGTDEQGEMKFESIFN